MQKRKCFHLSVSDRFGIDRVKQAADPLNIREPVGNDQSPATRQRRNRTSVRHHRLNRIGDFLGVEVLHVENNRHDFTGANIPGLLQAA